MTYSILALDTERRALGVATATGSLAVGGFVPHLYYGVGAVATQGAFTNWLYADRVMMALRIGMNAEAALKEVISKDDASDYRQLIVIDRWGQTAGHTGQENLEVKQHRVEAGLAIAGNMLANSQVIESMHDSYRSTQDLPLHERLFQVLEAAELAGGDFRGVHSCAIKVHSYTDPPIDLRVDWSDSNCIEKLRALHEKSLSTGYQAFIQGVPTLEMPCKHGVISSDEV